MPEPSRLVVPMYAALVGGAPRHSARRYSCRNKCANTFASPTMFSMIVYSFG